MKAIRIHTSGGADALRVDDVPRPEPQAGQVRVRIAAAGINFIDVYHRTGLYPVPLPYILGVEGAGEVEAVGSNVTGLAVGDRVAWAGPPGSYAEAAVLPAERLVKVPAGLSLEQAATAMLQGMTAHYLTTSTYPLAPGHVCLVHAAAGGAGLLIVQMAKRRGAKVIGTVSTEEKARLAREAGADKVVLYTQQDFESEAKAFSEGRGVDVVYDSVGRTTFEKSLSSLRPRGMLVLFGQSSGSVPPFDPALLSAKGSLFLTRPTLFHHVADRAALEERARDVLGAVADGSLKLRIDRTYPLVEAAAAHRALEGRQTAGKLLLAPA
jgi:NADPH2:quinone reductase